jgi:hypothetical protein
LIGIVGGPVLVIGYLAILFNAIDQHGPLAGVSAFPVAVFEFSLGIWLIARGFDPDAVAALESKNHAMVDDDRIPRDGVRSHVR